MERNLRRFLSKMFTKMKSERKSWDMKKERESERMKKLIKKIAIAVLAGTIAFSVVPATVQAAGWSKIKMDIGGRKMITVIRKISGKPFTENSIISTPKAIWIQIGREWTENGTTLVEKMMV